MQVFFLQRAESMTVLPEDCPNKDVFFRMPLTRAVRIFGRKGGLHVIGAKKVA